ncbi:F0F1 ATP synthase subunit delta [Pseudomonas sp.]|uniref:F0F1 ATP synthase subunit delta n=1 Tax=Pseudomonas sp. TaxID=306 RepID=UPI003D0F7BC0
MKFDWWTLGLQLANVLILVWLLSRFLFKPVARIIAERQRVAGALLDQAAAAKAAAEEQSARAKAANAELERQRAAALEAAQKDAEGVRAQLLQQAEADADHVRAKAMQALDEQQRAAQKRMDEHATQLALDIAEKLVARLPPSAQVAGFVDGLVAGLEHLPSGAREGLRSGPQHLQLHAPRALDEAELARVRQALAAALEQPVTLDVVVDPGLIAGLELSGGAAVIRNSFRADLARLRHDLMEGEHA